MNFMGFFYVVTIKVSGKKHCFKTEMEAINFFRENVNSGISVVLSYEEIILNCE